MAVKKTSKAIHHSISLHENLWDKVDEALDNSYSTNRSQEIARCVLAVYKAEGRLDDETRGLIGALGL